MGSEVIERAARAMEPDIWLAVDRGVVDRAKAEALTYPKVRAILTAIREPSEAQIDRFVSRALCVSVDGEGGWSHYARNQWQTMIDAALSE